MSVPSKFRQIGDFHEYYSGQAVAPYPTIFVGGNHEAGNYLFELYYGGWVAPSIYYVGAANVLRFGPLRIAGLSGIWKGYDYGKPHFERLPYNEDDVKSIYHVRELDVRKLMQLRTQVDVGLSHDWPRGVELCGNYNHLFKTKPFFREDSETGKLGSLAAKYVLDRLRPPHWFSAHLHVRYPAVVAHGDYEHPRKQYLATRQNQPVPQGVDKPSDIVQTPTSMTPKEIPTPQPSTPTSAISAWNNFSTVAAKQDAADREKFIQEQSQPAEDRSLDIQSIDSTFKQVLQDGTSRKIVTVHQAPAVQENVIVKNSDEIDLDLDSENEGGAGVDIKEAVPMDVDSKMETDDTNDAQISQPATQQIEQETHSSTDQGKAEDISENLRQQLPEGFQRPATEAARYGPLPDEIFNRQTQFLALGKCEEQRACHEYLELMEVFSVSDRGEAQSPFCLQYDPEWLAITRVFANQLELGNPKGQIPADLGDENYKGQIEKEEAWVQEHIVDKGKLIIPQNFEITAPVYDPEVPIYNKDMPPEYNNPQTAAFCELLDIENKFFLTPLEREQRMIDGPRPSRGGFGHGRHGQHRGRDNGWRGRGGRTGGGRSGRGGRGRGGRR
jgi:lariat debranching enzyme